MIYFLMFTSLAVFSDFESLKNAKKSTIFFYVSFLIIALLIAIYHYSNPDGISINDIIIKYLHMEGN